MPDGPGLDGLDDRVCRTEHRAACKASHDRAAAVDAGEGPVHGVAAQLQRLFNDRREVLFFADVDEFRVRYD